MPPLRKFEKEDIVNIAYEIVKKEGLERLNARKLAKGLNCSVQPIFHNFVTMEKLKVVVKQKIYNTYKEYIKKGMEEVNSYRGIGMAYIKFAKDYPEFFRILFMQKTNLNAENFMMSDSTLDDIIKEGQKLTGLSYEDQKQFHIKVWIFTHGIATMVATGTVNFTDEEISKILTSTVVEMLIGRTKIKEGK